MVSDYAPAWGDELPRPIFRHVGSGNTFGLEDGGNADREAGYTFSNLDLHCVSEDEWGI